MPRSPSPAEMAMRRFPCTRCGADPGDRCRTASGGLLSLSHSDRFDAATQAGALPLADDAEAGRG